METILKYDFPGTWSVIRHPIEGVAKEIAVGEVCGACKILPIRCGVEVEMRIYKERSRISRFERILVCYFEDSEEVRVEEVEKFKGS